MPRVLITGVAGHLGSRFARWLKQHVDCSIDGIDNLSCGYPENVNLDLRFHQQDLVDLPADWIKEPYDYVFHFAAMAAECLSPFVRRYHVRNNLEGSAALLNAVLHSGGCRRIVFTSSAAVYGAGRPPFSEASPCVPHDPYAAGKLFVESDLRIAGEQHGLNWTILRPHNIYGSGQNMWDRHRNVFGLWMRAALEGKPLRVFGDGRQTRAFSYIDDVLPCLWQAAVAPEANRQVINLGGETPTSVLGAAELVAGITGACAIEHVPARHEAKESYCTVEKSEALLGFEDRTKLVDGLEAMWDWARDAWGRHPERRDKPDAFSLELVA